MDIGASTWTEDDNANTAAAPDGAPEGMAPSGVNNVLRAHQGAIKRWYNWSVPRTTSGTGGAYALAYGAAPGALVDGMTHLVQFHAANAAAATLNVNALGALPIAYLSAGAWRVAPPGLWDADEVYRVAYHASSGTYRLLDLRNRTGEVQAQAGAVVPTGTLLCGGQAVSRTLYAGLFAALGTTHGGGDGATTFNLPDLRGRVAVGRSDMGGSDAGTLANGATLGLGIGGQSQTAVVNVSGSAAGTITGNTDIPISGQGNNVGGGSGEATNWYHVHSLSLGVNLPVWASGQSGTFSVVQPSRVLNYVVRF